MNLISRLIIVTVEMYQQKLFSCKFLALKVETARVNTESGGAFIPTFEFL